MTPNPLRFRRLLLPALALSVAPVTASAQACLGLHESRSVPTAEVVSNFHRDGITGPSTIGVSVTAGALFAGIQTGADVANGQSALGGNGLGVTAGISRPFGPLASCLGGTIARDEMAGATPTSSEALFGAASIKLPALLGFPLSAFGVASYESRTSSPVGLSSTSESGMAFRTGVAASIRPWLGLRVFEDRFDDEHRVGFSVGIVFPLKAADADGDGVIDAEDRCPNTPTGTPVSAEGCPLDSDGDGVIDAQDRCPNTPRGTAVNATGCPLDADGDGVVDAQDQCPNTPRGTAVNATGCPLDADGDGVVDAQDQCPNTPRGTAVNATGCPLDADGDGVVDAQDQCPNTPRGTAVNAEGCPLDADGDGVVETADACPNTPAGTAVDTRGCPKLFANAASFALTGVTFETSKAVIRPSSFAKLDEVAEALKANPDVRVEISGHTDNVGSDAANLRLSQARAESVRRYFIEKGVAADRMEARGYGEGRPVTTNDTVEGRAENRRVEMSRLP
jgi:outer membrane protein OmpA-like peptidoglycan-associated protein